MLGNAYTELICYEACWSTVASFAKVFTATITRVYNSCSPSYCVAYCGTTSLTTAELSATHALQYCLRRNKQNRFYNVITMDDLIKNYSNRMCF